MDNSIRAIAQLAAAGATPSQIASQLHVDEAWVEMVQLSDSYEVALEEARDGQ